MIRKRNIVIILIGLIIVITISIIAFTIWQRSQTPPVQTVSQSQNNGDSGEDDNNSADNNPSTTLGVAKTDTELIDSITQQDPSLVNANQQPSFGITKVVRTTSGWYVITIINKDDPSVGTAKVIMKESGSAGVVLVAGPGTSFSRDDFTFPDDVWKLL